MLNLGMICILFSGLLLLLGIGGLMISDLHLEFAVKTKFRFRAYCFALIFSSIVIAAVGEFILF